MAVNGASIAKINYQIVNDIKTELRLQGHFLHGDLERSFTEKQTLNEDVTALEAFAFAYLQDLEKGVSKEDIPALDTNSEEFRNLAKWVRDRGLEHSGERFMSANSIAEAIWRQWQKKGKPLESSKEFSKTGEIIGAIETIFKKREDNYFQQIDEAVVLTIDKKFFDDNNS